MPNQKTFLHLSATFRLKILPEWVLWFRDVLYWSVKKSLVRSCTATAIKRTLVSCNINQKFNSQLRIKLPVGFLNIILQQIHSEIIQLEQSGF